MDLLDFSPANNSKYGRRNLCKLCETTLKTAKNRGVACSIHGPHMVLHFPIRQICEVCDTTATFRYMVATLFRTDSRHPSGYRRVCKQCEAKGLLKEAQSI